MELQVVAGGAREEPPPKGIERQGMIEGSGADRVGFQGSEITVEALFRPRGLNPDERLEVGDLTRSGVPLGEDDRLTRRGGSQRRQIDGAGRTGAGKEAGR